MTNNKNIYGIDLDKPVTPLMVRDALVECFSKMHYADAELETNDPAINKEYCRNLVKKAFTDSEGDFEKPTKQSIINVLGKLEDFSANFRNQSVVQKNVATMMQIVEKISE